MPKTPDRIEEELEIEDSGADPTHVGGITHNAGSLRARDSLGVFNLRGGGSAFNVDSMLINRATSPLANRAGNLLRNQS